MFFRVRIHRKAEKSIATQQKHQHNRHNTHNNNNNKSKTTIVQEAIIRQELSELRRQLGVVEDKQRLCVRTISKKIDTNQATKASESDDMH